MTNPASSNSGFTALMGVVAALSGTDVVTVGVSDANQDAVQGFFRGQTLTSGSSGWLAESYVREQDRLGGIVNYESVLMELNESGELREPLVLLYPKEGIVTADYPLILLNAEKREAYDKLVAYLRSPEVQERIMTDTLRRPAVPQVPLSDAFPKNILVELPFPGSREVVDSILYAYLNEVRRPSHAFFVLDVSGSMAGERLEGLQNALRNLTGLDDTLTGQFARFSDRERLMLVTFSSGVTDVQDFALEAGAAREPQVEAIRAYVGRLYADGGTAIFSALQEAYALAEAAHDIKTFPILFGEADEDSLETVAEETGGRLFDGRGESLSAVFKQIRGYQ